LPQTRNVLVHEIVGDHHAPGRHIPKLRRNPVWMISERKFSPKYYDFRFRCSGMKPKLAPDFMRIEQAAVRDVVAVVTIRCAARRCLSPALAARRGAGTCRGFPRGFETVE
jgi:hypothetical protein